MSLISERYAGAFYDAANEAGKQELCRDELVTLDQIFRSEPDLTGFLSNPQKTLTKKSEAIQGIFSGTLDPLTLNFLLLLLGKGRLDQLSSIVRDYQSRMDRDENVIHIHITTAMEADPEQVQKICDKFQALYHASRVKVDTSVDPELIGGAVITVGDTMYDESLKGRLDALRTEISSS